MLQSMAEQLSGLATLVKAPKSKAQKSKPYDETQNDTTSTRSEDDGASVRSDHDVTSERPDFLEFIRMVQNMREELLKQASFTRFLKSLHFGEIKERISDVHKAHEGTFTWLFNREVKVNMIHWLESENANSIYWLSGNAGSGKSTLMKYIVNHPQATESLRQWSGSQNLLVANHFFWSTGTRLQKSQEGLFMTLLFQIFTQNVNLIPLICPKRWKQDSLLSIDKWTLEELFDAFRRLVSIDTSKLGVPPFRICIFIDGLDEYSGDHRELASLLHELSSHARIKICASSRPWVEFRDAFDQSPWKLSLHELTREDVEKYVTDRLPQQRFHHKWTETHSASTIASLAHQICDRAQGVFLWVFLVVRSLRTGLANGDGLMDLQRRLNELPSDLDPYFMLMLNRIDKVYRRRTARLFKSLLHTESDLPVIAFHYLDLEEEDPNYATTDWIEPLTEVQIRGLSRSKEYQITAQCKDLIKISIDDDELDLFRYRAGFLHRTVADFFRTRTLDDVLDTLAEPGFDPRITLSKIFLSLLKTMPRSWVTKDAISMERIRRLMLGVLSYAQELETVYDCAQSPLLDDLQKEMSSLVRLSDWPSILPDSKCESIFGFSVRCGSMSRYVEHLASRSDLSQIQQTQLLEQALKPMLRITLMDSFGYQTIPEIDTKTLAVLLGKGPSPNVSSGLNHRFTIWSHFLYFMPSPPPKGAYEACRIMITAGAERYVTERKERSGMQHRDVADTLRSKFGPKKAEVLVSLFKPSFSEEQAATITPKVQTATPEVQAKTPEVQATLPEVQAATPSSLSPRPKARIKIPRFGRIFQFLGNT